MNASVPNSFPMLYWSKLAVLPLPTKPIARRLNLAALKWSASIVSSETSSFFWSLKKMTDQMKHQPVLSIKRPLPRNMDCKVTWRHRIPWHNPPTAIFAIGLWTEATPTTMRTRIEMMLSDARIDSKAIINPSTKLPRRVDTTERTIRNQCGLGIYHRVWPFRIYRAWWWFIGMPGVVDSGAIGIASGLCPNLARGCLFVRYKMDNRWGCWLVMYWWNC